MTTNEPGILVTGGAGYIGSHTCKALRNAGYLPVAFDNLSRGNQWAVNWGPLEIGDISNRQQVERVIDKYRPCAIIHFAAYAYVGESVVDPALYYTNNLAGSINLIEAARKKEIKNFSFSSSCATYGIPETLPITDDHPQSPVNPYGTTKLVIERILKDYEKAYGLNWAALRYFNAAGADTDTDIGECHRPETHLIPNILSAALGQSPKLTVHGEDYPTPDGTCIRDYIHVTDLADAHLKTLEDLRNKKGSLAVNLGTGTGYSIKEIIQHVEKLTGREITLTFGPRRQGDPPSLIASNKKATMKLGWVPRFSDMETIIETALKWHKGSKINTLKGNRYCGTVIRKE